MALSLKFSLNLRKSVVHRKRNPIVTRHLQQRQITRYISPLASPNRLDTLVKLNVVRRTPGPLTGRRVYRSSPAAITTKSVTWHFIEPVYSPVDVVVLGHGLRTKKQQQRGNSTENRNPTREPVIVSR